MREMIWRAGAVAVTALVVIAASARYAAAQGTMSVSGGVLVVPQGHGDNGRYAGIGVKLAGNRDRGADVDLFYLTSERSWEYYPPCLPPGCAHTVVERIRREMVGGGPTFFARLGASRFAVLVGAELLWQRGRSVNESPDTWLVGVSPGLRIDLLQRGTIGVELEARVHKMLTGGAFAPWLLPVGVAVRF